MFKIKKKSRWNLFRLSIRKKSMSESGRIKINNLERETQREMRIDILKETSEKWVNILKSKTWINGVFTQERGTDWNHGSAFYLKNKKRKPPSLRELNICPQKSLPVLLVVWLFYYAFLHNNNFFLHFSSYFYNFNVSLFFGNLQSDEKNKSMLSAQ